MMYQLPRHMRELEDLKLWCFELLAVGWSCSQLFLGSLAKTLIIEFRAVGRSLKKGFLLLVRLGDSNYFRSLLHLT